MAEVVRGANVIVALLYAYDSLHQRAVDLTTRLAVPSESIDAFFEALRLFELVSGRLM